MLLERAKSQVLLVDMQQRLVPAMAPAVPERGVPGAADVMTNCGNLLQAAGKLGIPTTASEQYPQGLGPTVPELAALVPAGRTFAKMEFSCAANPGLRAELDRAGRRQVVLAGIEAHVCVLQTALELRAAGYAVAVVADAVASRRPASRETALARMAAAGVVPVTTEMVLFEWLRSAADPEFRALSRLIR